MSDGNILGLNHNQAQDTTTRWRSVDQAPHQSRIYNFLHLPVILKIDKLFLEHTCQDKNSFFDE